MTRKSHISGAALLAIVLTACAVSPTGRRQLALVSEDSAIAASDEAYAMQIGELRKEGKIVPESSRVARRESCSVGIAAARLPFVTKVTSSRQPRKG